MNIQKIMSSLEAKHPGESEYLQAVKEVLLSIEAVSYTHLTTQNRFTRRMAHRYRSKQGIA